MRGQLSICAAFLAIAVGTVACTSTPTTKAQVSSDVADAQDRINNSVTVVSRMKAEPATAALLAQARGVLLVPNYGKGAWIVGGQGGKGVLLVRRGTRWSDPAFYSLGGISIGLQIGGAAGPIALILMTDKAIVQFRDRTGAWSLGADAGLTVVNNSEHQGIAGTTPPADVVVWSGTKGLFGGISAGAMRVQSDGALNDAYYNGLVTTRQILTGAVRNANADPLRDALVVRVATTQ
jgi:SH3 domain-containing YSC84-like protein 1